jgi:hypothetical protein
VHYRRKYIVFVFIASGVAMCAGCMSRRVGEALGPVVLETAVEPAFGGPFDLARGVNEFRVTRRRWPKDYPEFSNFLKDSDPDAYRSLQAVRFSRIEFSEAPNGWLRVNAEYPFPPSIHTASGITVKSSGGTVTISDMTIGPEDPREMPNVDIRQLRTGNRSE